MIIHYCEGKMGDVNFWSNFILLEIKIIRNNIFSKSLLIGCFSQHQVEDFS